MKSHEKGRAILTGILIVPQDLSGMAYASTKGDLGFGRVSPVGKTTKPVGGK